MISYGQFLAGFPEFAQAPQATVEFWITQAYAQLNAYRLGTQLDFAAMLYVAHNLVRADKAQKAAQLGAAIGDATGPIQTKTVGPVTVSYDTQAAVIEGAGQWNSTAYGQQLYQIMRGASLGGAYVPAQQRVHGPLGARILGF